ncbi:conjugal transfer protein TraD [Acinetobacter baumannii]|uniref:conjugal transfer protein TraD n=1 Tax=Acinetobacter baumannii TaxID=470 RepID=UPI0008DD50E2|nr:conjugal transfer protein TraD [Acinetobacter baumannii]MCE6930375.1 conjugal transfer protein TraD [Acinetobacter baumannii]MCZ0638433.1 conjugal transfer protein TraD [Acinetobacter baumannii]MVO43816.1 conjugal transfer protein TraD [Acinetobacter baumannii]OIB66660.1 conjugal transfer protein TraD [Acinetobacter baumannii]OIE94420.1 conjugal transfer protein TraD [Acinetobacter baumannii]
MNLENFKFTNDQKTFVTDEIERLKKLENKSQNEDLILSLVSAIESGSPTKQQISSFERVMKNEFKKYKARLELEKIKEDEKKLLASLKKEAQAAQAKDRKKREHKLISIGALFEMVDFPTEDKGIITGLLLDAMEKAKSNNGLFQQFKISGDKFITEREQSRKAKSTVVDNSQ